MSLGIISIIMLIIFSGIATAIDEYTHLKMVSKSLRGSNDNETINNVKLYVLENVQYQFFYHPKTVMMVWNSKIGDCTDQATLMKEMLRLNGITTQKAHGYCDGVKHDWIRIGKQDIDNFECTKKVYKGSGYW